VSTFVELNDDFIIAHDHIGRDIQKIAKDLFSLCPFVFPANSPSHKSIEGSGHQSDLQIEVDLQPDHRGKSIEVKELDGIGDPVLNEHPLRIPRYEGRAFDVDIIGEQDGRFFVTEIGDGYLPKFAIIAFEADALIQHFWSSEGAGERLQRNPAPGRWRPAPDLSQHFPRSAP